MSLIGKPYKFVLQESLVETKVIVISYLCCLPVIFFYSHNIDYFHVVLTVLTGLMLWESFKYFNRKSLVLEISIFPEQHLIEISEFGRSKKYSKFSIYSCRWFAILSVRERFLRKSILLTKDRFTSKDEYSDIRFLLLETIRKVDAD